MKDVLRQTQIWILCVLRVRHVVRLMWPQVCVDSCLVRDWVAELYLEH